MKFAKLFPIAILLFVMSCAAGTKIETTKADDNETNSAQTSTAAGGGEIAVNNSTEPEQTQQNQTSPDAVVKDLYAVHAKNLGKILNGKSRTLLDKYFDRNLADLIWKDLTTHQNEVGVLDFDPFYNAQDIEIKKLTIGAPKIQNDKADVTVNFENYGTKETINYALVQQNGAWKIANIKYKDGSSLLKYFQEAAADEAANGNFEGTYQVGETTCTVKPVKMAFEVRWAKGSGVEMFFFQGRENDRYNYGTADNGKGVNTFSLNESADVGEFLRADGKRFAVKKIR